MYSRALELVTISHLTIRGRGPAAGAPGAAHFFDLGGPSHYSGNYLIGFEHCGAHFFDLRGPSHYSGDYLFIGFEHCDKVNLDIKFKTAVSGQLGSQHRSSEMMFR